MVPLRLVVGKKQNDSNQTLDFDEVRMPRLLSVNVGLPRDVTWNGKTVRTSVWKSPVAGRPMARKLDIDGDAQADLAGHGGEHRAVFVYRMDSYHYWERFLGRNDFALGQFGENFTVDGLPDNEVCIGDGLRNWGVLPGNVHTEIFGSLEAITPGVAQVDHIPHVPQG